MLLFQCFRPAPDILESTKPTPLLLHRKCLEVHCAEDQDSRVPSDASQRPLPQAIFLHSDPCFLPRQPLGHQVRLVAVQSWAHRTNYLHCAATWRHQVLRCIRLQRCIRHSLRIRHLSGIHHLPNIRHFHGKRHARDAAAPFPMLESAYVGLLIACCQSERHSKLESLKVS